VKTYGPPIKAETGVKPAEDFVAVCDVVEVEDDTSEEGIKIDLNLEQGLSLFMTLGISVMSHYRCLRTTRVTHSKKWAKST